MRQRSSLLITCLVVALGSVACWGGPPAPPLTATSTPPGTATTRGSITPTDIAAARTVPTTATARLRPTDTAPATPPVPTPAPTEPRLDLNPPGTSARPRITPTPIPTPSLSGREATISQVQGTDQNSPLLGEVVRVKGIVTANFQETPTRSFYIQEGELPRTAASTGIQVVQGEHPTPEVKVGDEVMVVGIVIERNSGTILDISRVGSGLIVTSSGNPLPLPIELRPPANESDARRYLTQYEGMLVSVPRAVARTPTDEGGSFVVVRLDGTGPRTTGALTVGAASGTRYVVDVGEVIDGIIGPLDRQGDRFIIQQLPEQRLVISPPLPTNPSAPATPRVPVTPSGTPAEG
jgi:hypothetical protein